jgi:membrane-associated phospholipid phosphatase
MPTLFAALAALYGLSLAGLYALGFAPTFPDAFLGFVAVFVPFAYVASRGVFLLEKLLARRPAWLPPAGVLLGLLLVGWHRLPLLPLVALVLLAVTLWDLLGANRLALRPLAASVAVLFVGNGAVWSLNYLAGLLAGGRLHDAAVLETDLALCRWAFGTAGVEGMYPLVKCPFLFDFLESNYVMLYAEVFVVTFVLIQRRARLASFFAAVFACYLLGVVVFCVYPVFGPYLHPGALHPDYRGSLTYQIMADGVAEFAAVRSGASVNGVAYFVGLPSLHAAMALLFQIYLYPSRGHFWVFLPINVFMALSTVLLGFHYLIDLPAGLLLPLLVLAAGKVLVHSPPPSVKMGPAVSPVSNTEPFGARRPSGPAPESPLRRSSDPCPSTSSAPTATASVRSSRSTSARR